MKLLLHEFDLKIKERFKIAHSVRDSQETLIVELQDTTQPDLSGLGEATANTYYGFTLKTMRRELEALRGFVENYQLRGDRQHPAEAGTPEDFWEALYPRLPHSPFTLCALDMAAHDLFGKKLGKPLYKLWGLDPNTAPASNYTIGIDTIDHMMSKMKAVSWPLYKIKLGTDEDLDIIRALRKNTNAVFRVDANCAWGVDQTIRYSEVLAKLNVEFIEQPLPADDMEGMKEVYQHSRLPVMADESCISEKDVDKCHAHFHGINIKLTKCGGITPARRMIRRARQLNMRVMVGCMTETSVGISAIAHLAPMLDYVDMDGALLLAEDIATGVQVKEHHTEFAQENGTGARLLAQGKLQQTSA